VRLWVQERQGELWHPVAALKLEKLAGGRNPPDAVPLPPAS